MLSEELQAQLAEQAEAGLAVDATSATVAAPQDNVWAVALRCVALAAAVTAALTALSAVWAPLILATWLWAMASPVVVLGVFQSRSPRSPITTGFGARLGLLTGMAVSFVLIAMNTVSMLIMRRMHGMGEFDTRMAAMVDGVRAQAAAQPGAPALPLAQAMALPEFRAGMVLLGMAAMAVMLMVLTTAGGAFAGFLRSRQRA